jgi:hypothetical protein
MNEKDTKTDLIDMARQLYCAKIEVSNLEETIKITKDSLKKARAERDRILDDMASIGKTVGPKAAELRRAS